MMLEPVITESAVGVSMIGILALLALLGMLLGAVVLVGVLLANRHTRGVGLGLLAAGGIGLVLLSAVFVWSRGAYLEKARHDAQMAEELYWEQAEVNHAPQNTQDTMPEVTITTNDHTAESIAEFIDGASVELANESNKRIVYHSNKMDTVMRLPVVLLALLLALALLYIAFKHGGPVVGFGLLCLPVLLVAVFFFIALKPSSMVTYSRTDSVSYAPPSVDPPSVVDSEIASPSYVIPLEAKEKTTSDDTTVQGEDVEATGTDDTSTDDTSTDGTSTDDTSTETANATSENKNETDKPASPKATLPDWTDAPAKQVGNVYRQSLQVGPFATAGECQKHMDREIDHALTQYISHIALEEHGGTTNNCPSIAMLHISPQYVRENIIREEYYETVVSSVSDNMKTLHLLLEIDNRAHHSLMEYWRAYTQKSRVFLMTGIAGSLLALLAGILGLMKLDTYTKGFYTKRLFIGVPLAIIGLLLLLVA